MGKFENGIWELFSFLFVLIMKQNCQNNWWKNLD